MCTILADALLYCSLNLLAQNRCGIIFIITTAVLGFMFLPKMIQKRAASSRESATSGAPSRYTAQATRSAGITSRFSSNNADPVVTTRASNVEQQEEVKGEKTNTDESLPTEEVICEEKVGNDSAVKV